MIFHVFNRLFKDNNHYDDYEDLPYLGSLAYVVQEFLYTNISQSRNPYLLLDGRINLYDFMTLAAYFICSSHGDFGKTTIKEYIASLYQHERIGFESIKYTKDGLEITNASSVLVISILWAAYIYNQFCYKLFSMEKWKKVSLMLYDLMLEEWNPESKEDEEEFKEIPAIKRSEEAVFLMIRHLRKKIKEEDTVEDNTNNIKEKKEINQNDKIENQQTIDIQLVQSEVERLKNEVNRLTQEKEEMTIELLMPIFYNKEQDVREFLEKIDGRPDTEITDTVHEWVKARKISEKSKGRALWSILHAAKYYSSTESNWNTALRNHPK